MKWNGDLSVEIDPTHNKLLYVDWNDDLKMFSDQGQHMPLINTQWLEWVFIQEQVLYNFGSFEMKTGDAPILLFFFFLVWPAHVPL